MHLSTTRRKDRGFTLVELLIVIVILGVLATITVFAVRGIVDKGGESACSADWRNMEHAQEANMALKGVYAIETELLNNELLHSESGNVDVTLINAARVLGAKDGTIFARVVVPAALATQESRAAGPVTGRRRRPLGRRDGCEPTRCWACSRPQGLSCDRATRCRA